MIPASAPQGNPELANGFVQRPPPGKKPPVRRFPVIKFKDIEPVLDGLWIVKGLLPAQAFTVVYGDSQAGKSFLLLDCLLHVAAGRDWAGRKVTQKRVLYFAAEGQKGFLNRMIVARTRLELPDETPFDLIVKVPNFGTSREDALALIEEIKADYGGDLPEIIAIDTLSQTMGGGNENSPDGMGTFLANMRLIAEALDCTVVIVHHTGKDAQKGERGHSSLPFNLDARWLVEKVGGASRVTIKKQREGQDMLSWQFRLNKETVGFDEDNYEVTSCTVEITQAPEPLHPQSEAAAAAAKAPSRSHREFDAAFDEALLEEGETYYVGGDMTAAVKALRVPAIKPYFRRRWATGEGDPRAQAKKASTAFARIISNPPPAYYRATAGETEWIWKIAK